MTPIVTPSRVLEIIAAHGSDPDGWPEAERLAAVAVLKANPERYAEALSEARVLDEAIAAVPEPALPEGLAARILADAPRARTSKAIGSASQQGYFKRLFGTRDGLWPIRAAAASLVTGVAVGYGAMASTTDTGFDADDVFYMGLESGFSLDFEETDP